VTEFVVGFDGSSGSVRAGTADSTAVVLLPIDRPAVPRVLGYWEDDATEGWEPPRGEVGQVVRKWLGDPFCRGGGFDPSGWADEVAEWTSEFGPRLLTPRLGLSTAYRGRAWGLLHEAILRTTVVFDKAADDFPLLQSHVLAARLDDFARVQKEHRGRSAGRIDVAAALAYAVIARLEAIEKSGRPASSEPPSWPARSWLGNRHSGYSTGWRPVNVPCALPDCDEPTGANFCCEDHLAKYKGWWPGDARLHRPGRKLVAPPKPAEPDRLVATYGRQRQADTTVISEGNGNARVAPSRFR
jgi:hypothetical protein